MKFVLICLNTNLPRSVLELCASTKVSTSPDESRLLSGALACLSLLYRLLVEIGFPASDYVGKRVFSSDEQLLSFDLRSQWGQSPFKVEL